MKIPVTIYTTPNCPQCMMTARKMDTLGIVYDKVDLTFDEILCWEVLQKTACGGQ